jgi:hypothetical protein
MLKIDERVVQALLNYLATKPYAEVANVMPILQRLETVEGTVSPMKPEVETEKKPKKVKQEV